MEKADQMNRIDYHFSMAVKYDPPKEVADISVAEDPDIHNLLLIGLDSESASGKAKTCPAGLLNSTPHGSRC